MPMATTGNTPDHHQWIMPAPTREERRELGLEISHRWHDPVMLIGHGSSGTTIATGLIRKYCGVAFANESQFLIRFARHAPLYGDLRNPSNLRRLVDDMLRERYFERAAAAHNFRPTADEIISQTREPTCSGVYRAVFELLARNKELDRWGDKTPEYMHHLPELQQIFPDAQWIFSIRDGRDVALSVRKQFWGGKNVVIAALEWRSAAEAARVFLSELTPGRHLTLRYEDMLQQPVDVVRKMMDFLEATPVQDGFYERIAQMIPSELKLGNFSKWKTGLSSREREIYESIAGDSLRAFGYETEFDNPRPPTRLEMAWAPWDDRLQRYCFAGTWRDAVYRGGMRLNDLKIRLREYIRKPSMLFW